MQDHVKTREQLIDELTELRSQVLELETALKALPEPESKYREIIDSVGEAVFVIQDGFITFSNQACSELTGYSHEETSTFNAIILLVHPDDQEMVAQNHARRLQGDTRHLRYDFRIICKHGTVKWVELNSSLIMWEGKPAALCLATDITERKQTEEYLKESQDLIKVLVDSLPVGLLYVDSLEKIVFANQTFGSWWGMPGANLSGHTVEDILGDHYACDSKSPQNSPSWTRNVLRRASEIQRWCHERNSWVLCASHSC